MTNQTHQDIREQDMEKLTLRPPNVELTAEEKELWEKTLTAGVIAQRLIDGSIAVGGTATSIYARHRVSFDTDHILITYPPLSPKTAYSGGLPAPGGRGDIQAQTSAFALYPVFTVGRVIRLWRSRQHR